MDIESQKADTIYNINGNFILEGTAESVREVQKASQNKLGLIHSVSYFDLLDRNLSAKTLLRRPVLLEAISNTLSKGVQFAIFGEPGIGKTSIIYSFVKQLDSKVVYISIKGKSELTIILHLINRILAENGSEFISTQDVDEAYGLLQSVLINSSQIFVIDDCEQNDDLIAKIIPIDKFTTKFIYVTRNKSIPLTLGIEVLQITPFSEEEAKHFLDLHDIKLGTVEFNELYNASQGNPLYLYYFSQQQITPLPKDILSYQNSIWLGLNSEQKEIISYISICHFNPTVAELAGIFPTKTALVFAEDISNISNLVNNKDGFLEIFHLSFKEHVIDYLSSHGLLNLHSLKLGKYYIENDGLVQAAYLLADIEPSLIQDNILAVFPVLVDLGELRFALKLLKIKLGFSKSKLETGYIYYHISNITHQLGNREEAMSSIETSIDILKDIDNKQFYFPALMVKAMNLGERGKSEEAKDLADQVFDNISAISISSKGVLLVNLAKIYVDLFEFEKGAKASKEAYEIFQGLDSKKGMLGSLVNLVSCLSQINGYLSESELYANKILDMTDDNSNFSIRIVAMNVLTSTYRKLENFEKAKYYGSKVIKLCQKYELKEKVVLNLVNYANIIRDEGDLAKAITLYDEALFYAKEYGIQKDECRIYWIKSSVSRQQEDFVNSLAHAEKAIDAGSLCNFLYGIAHGWQQKAITLSAMGLYTESANAYEECASCYKKISGYKSEYFSSLFQAINLYHQEGSKENMLRVILVAVENSNSNSEDGDESASLFTQIDGIPAINYFEQLVKNYFERDSTYDLTRPLITYLSLCTESDTSDAIESVKRTVEIFLENIDNSNVALALLGITIQQSADIISVEYILEISRVLSDKLPLFSVRVIDEKVIVVVSIKDKINLELICQLQDAASVKALFCLTLTIHQFPNLIIDKNNFIESSLQIILEPYSTLVEILAEANEEIEYPFSNIEQSIILMTESYGLPIPIVLSPEFQEKSSLQSNVDDKALLYFLVTSICKIKGDFYHMIALDSREERKIIMEKVGKLLGYDSFEHNSDDADFHIDIQKLS
jgi:tetratricopeptide (TPR) repeat protein